jgi:hypothetical protein
MTRTETTPAADGPSPDSTNVAPVPPTTILRHGVPVPAAPGRPEPSSAAFAVWLDRQAEQYRLLGSERGTWLAQQIDQLARQARILDADSPATFDDRLSAWSSALESSERPAVTARIGPHGLLPMIDDEDDGAADNEHDLDDVPALRSTPDPHDQPAS